MLSMYSQPPAPNLGPPPPMGGPPPGLHHVGPPPPINTSMPPPSQPPPGSFQSLHFKPFKTPDSDFDGKRLRKSVMRKTVDYNSSVVAMLEARVWQRDERDRCTLQPDICYASEVMPPQMYLDNPINAVVTKFVRTSTNKQKCPVFALAWTPEGRRLVTGASSGEFTLWNGLTFNFETILKAHETSVRTMLWSHNDQWMVTGDTTGIVKYWQTNMNNVKHFQAHKDPVRGLRYCHMLHTHTLLVLQHIPYCSLSFALQLGLYQLTDTTNTRYHIHWCAHGHIIASLPLKGAVFWRPVRPPDPNTTLCCHYSHLSPAGTASLQLQRGANTMSKVHFVDYYNIIACITRTDSFRNNILFVGPIFMLIKRRFKLIFFHLYFWRLRFVAFVLEVIIKVCVLCVPLLFWLLLGVCSSNTWHWHRHRYRLGSRVLSSDYCCRIKALNRELCPWVSLGLPCSLRCALTRRILLDV